MYIVTPIQITESMLQAGTTIAEPAAGETLWVSGGTYAVGDIRIRAETHRCYECVLAHTGVTTTPESDPLRWKDKGPTMRHAPFDVYVSTAAKASGSLTFVITPGFCTTLLLYGAIGNTADITYKEEVGGATLVHKSMSLFRDAFGLYEYLFTPPRPLGKVMVTDLPIRPNAEITITLTGSAVELGMVVIGHLIDVTEGAEWGGTSPGATATPTTNSYIRVDDDGVIEIKRRNSGTNLDLSVVMPTKIADIALLRVQDVLDIPVAVIGSKEPGFTGLNSFGLIKSADVRYEDAVVSRLTAKLQGMF